MWAGVCGAWPRPCLRWHGVILKYNGDDEHGNNVAVGFGTVSGMVVLIGPKVGFGTENGVTETGIWPGDFWVESGVRLRNLFSKSDGEPPDDLQGLIWLGTIAGFGEVFCTGDKW